MGMIPFTSTTSYTEPTDPCHMYTKGYAQGYKDGYPAGETHHLNP
jgi:hypothetical protein